MISKDSGSKNRGLNIAPSANAKKTAPGSARFREHSHLRTGGSCKNLSQRADAAAGFRRKYARATGLEIKKENQSFAKAEAAKISPSPLVPAQMFRTRSFRAEATKTRVLET